MLAERILASGCGRLIRKSAPSSRNCSSTLKLTELPPRGAGEGFGGVRRIGTVGGEGVRFQVKTRSKGGGKGGKEGNGRKLVAGG